MIITLPSLIKKLVVTVIMVVGALVSTNLHAQSQEIDFKYRVDSTTVGRKIKYTVDITVTQGTGPFTVGIYEDLYKDGLKEIIKKDNVQYSIQLSFYGRRALFLHVKNRLTGKIKQIEFKQID